MRNRYSMVIREGFLLLAGMIAAGGVYAQGPTVEDVFPLLATGILQSATMADLNDGIVMLAGDVHITSAEIENRVNKAEKQVREQLQKNLFFVLETMATEKIIVREAYNAGYTRTNREDQLVRAFLQQKLSGIEVSDVEAKTFYDENKETIGVPFEQAQNYIKHYLAQNKEEASIGEYIRSLGRESDIQVDRKWVEKQYASAIDNPVDRARRSGKPTMIEFGATGCGPCDMMQPILENMRNKYKDSLNVVFVHVRDDEILAARYGITSIPVQVFFDKTGKEFFRHVGFYPQAQVEKKLSEMGGFVDEKNS
jgi:thiol-disulfide isomerase/thioredoxin